VIRADPTPRHADSTSVVGRRSSWVRPVFAKNPPRRAPQSLRQPVTTTGTRNELTPTKEHTVKITTNDGTTGRPTLALRRRSDHRVGVRALGQTQWPPRARYFRKTSLPVG
jgi:hypothetical protein